MKVDHLTEAEQQQLKQAKILARVVGLIIPAGMTALCAFLFLLWIPRLPNPLASHWGANGEADGFSSPWLSLVMFTVVAIFAITLYFIPALTRFEWLKKPGSPAWGPVNRLLPAVVLATVSLISTMEIGQLALQLDLNDATEMASFNPVMFVAFGVAIVAAILGYLVQPKLQISGPVNAEAGAPLELSDTERAVWFGTASASRAYWWVTGSAMAIVFGTLALTMLSPEVPVVAFAISVGISVAVLVLLVMCSWFSVSIDEQGLRAQPVFRWPSFAVKASEIERVEVGEISPIGEFGGWGLRWAGGGQFGIVLRTGEGIRVHRKNGKCFVITLDDAETAAAVLNTVAARAQSGSAKEQS